VRGGPHLDDLLDFAHYYGASVTWKPERRGRWHVEIELSGQKYGVVHDSIEEAAATLLGSLDQPPEAG